MVDRQEPLWNGHAVTREASAVGGVAVFLAHAITANPKSTDYG
jgi:hypothetical protein